MLGLTTSAGNSEITHHKQRMGNIIQHVDISRLLIKWLYKDFGYYRTNIISAIYLVYISARRVARSELHRKLNWSTYEQDALCT